MSKNNDDLNYSYLISFPKLLQSIGALSTHGLGEVTEGGRVGEVQLKRVVIGEDPREHRVLHQVVIRPPRQRI